MSAIEFLAGVIGVGAAAALAFAASPDPTVPIQELTPGVVASTDPAEVCALVDGRSYSVRHRAQWHDKYHSLRLYGYDVRSSAKWELDHRIPLSLGGADVEANRWPEPWTGQMNAHDKDQLEYWAWRTVCVERTLSLRDAQAIFLGDWREAYGALVRAGQIQKGVSGE